MLSFSQYLTEVLDIKARIARRASLRKNKSKIKQGRKRAEKLIATKEKLEARSRKAARNMIMKRLLKGKSKDDLSFSQRAAIEKRLDKMKPVIDKLAKRLFPKIKKAELDKKRGGKGSSE